MKWMVRGGRGLFVIALTIIVIALFFSPSVGRTASIFGCPENCLPDDPGKFNGMWWGQSLRELKDMRFVSPDPTNSGELFYVREGDVLQLGDARLDYIQYGFWRGIYSSVAYGTTGANNWEALKRICFENFDPWHKPNRNLNRYYWVGKNSAMTLEYDETLSIGRLYIYSKVIYERQLAQERQGAEPGWGGFWHAYPDWGGPFWR